MWRIIRNLVIAAVLVSAGWYVISQSSKEVATETLDVSVDATEVAVEASELPHDDSDDRRLKSLLISMLGVALIAGGMAALVWPFAGTLGSFFESLFWVQGGKVNSPPMYKLAAWLAEQGRYGESLEEYKKIVKLDKQSTVAYEGQLYVMIYEMGMGGETPAVQNVMKTARKKIPPQDVPHLEWFYEQLLAGNPEACAHPPRVEEL